MPEVSVVWVMVPLNFAVLPVGRARDTLAPAIGLLLPSRNCTTTAGARGVPEAALLGGVVKVNKPAPGVMANVLLLTGVALPLATFKT